MNIMNFRDPVTTYAYNLISLHHDIMWYIIIILTLVYWSLYKVLKDYSWSSFNKQEGFLLFFLNNKIIYKVQKLIFFLWITIFLYSLMYIFVNIFLVSVTLLDRLFAKKRNIYRAKWVKFYFFLLGKNYFKDIDLEYLKGHMESKNWSIKIFNKMMLERAFSYYLFSKTSNAIYFYDGTDNVLSTLKFKHSINLEYVFGLFPTIIIGFIIVPSMYLLYSNETDINPCITIKVIGHQWYWSYESTSANFIKKTKEIIYLNYNYESIIVNEDDLKGGRRRLLETDTSLVIPYNVVLRFLITSADVLHSWAIPEMGIKVDAVPGRLNQVITIPSNLGIYYGQCSEICGVSHGFMPIKVNVVSLSNYYNLLLK